MQDTVQALYASGTSTTLRDNYRMFTFLVSNSNVDYRLLENYFPNCCLTTPIAKLARATRDRILIKHENTNFSF